MDFNQSVYESVGVLIALILIAMGLRKAGVVKEEHSALFAKVITQFTLPALIFNALSITEFDPEKFLLAAVMIISQVICALIAWGLSVLLKLSRPRKGALILGSTFTSSGFLGYAVIKQIYPGNTEALSDAAIVSELGVALLIFTLGIMIAISFGVKKTTKREEIKETIAFFKSPIFFALVLGIVFSVIRLPQNNWLVHALYNMLSIVGAANTLLVTLTIGIMLHFRDIRKVFIIVILACVIKLIIQPCLSFSQAQLFSFPDLWRQIVVIEAAMPTAALSAVFAKKYGCDAELTTILVFATFFSSILTIIMMVFLLN